jgi:Leucine Rich repeat
VSYNPPGVDGLRSLARELQQNRGLRRLDFSDTAAVPIEIPRCLRLSSVRELSVSGNVVSPAVASMFAEAAVANPWLSRLRMDRTKLQDAGSSRFSACAASAVTALWLLECGIGPEGAHSLACALPPQLATLDLSFNSLGDAGACSIARAAATHLAHRSCLSWQYCNRRGLYDPRRADWGNEPPTSESLSERNLRRRSRPITRRDASRYHWHPDRTIPRKLLRADFDGKGDPQTRSTQCSRTQPFLGSHAWVA